MIRFSRQRFTISDQEERVDDFLDVMGLSFAGRPIAYGVRADFQTFGDAVLRPTVFQVLGDESANMCEIVFETGGFVVSNESLQLTLCEIVALRSLTLAPLENRTNRSLANVGDPRVRVVQPSALVNEIDDGRVSFGRQVLSPSKNIDRASPVASAIKVCVMSGPRPLR